MKTFDFIVIGGGPGGYVSAIRAAQLGLKVALIEEREMLGGTCLNVGCIPSKVLLESSEIFHAVNHRVADFGIDVPPASLDLKRMMANKDRVVSEITQGVDLLMKKNKVTRFRGRGRLKGGKVVEIEREKGKVEIGGTRIVLAMGSVPVELPFLPFDGHQVISSSEALCLDQVPERMVIVGAGAIGLELGSVWSRLGSRVTVVEILRRVAIFADRMLSRMLEKSLKSQGLEFLLSSKVVGAEVKKNGIDVAVTGEKVGDRVLTCDRLLVAVGRRPNTGDCGLEAAAVERDDSGRVRVDEHWCTSAEGVFAIGDLIHGPMLAHKAEEEGIAVAEQAAGKPGHVNYGVIPNVIYTAPELAQVGLTEEEARERKIPVKTGRNYFAANGRARSLREEEGLVKVIAHKETDELLGVHILGPRASEMIAEAAVAMEFRASAEDLARTCHAHPTLSETIREAALAVDRRAIHG
jgi:dihydrolipoamide dehydrogenase